MHVHAHTDSTSTVHPPTHPPIRPSPSTLFRRHSLTDAGSTDEISLLLVSSFRHPCSPTFLSLFLYLMSFTFILSSIPHFFLSDWICFECVYVRACVRVCMCVCVCVRARARACLRVFMRACVCACSCVRAWMCGYACVYYVSLLVFVVVCFCVCYFSAPSSDEFFQWQESSQQQKQILNNLRLALPSAEFIYLGSSSHASWELPWPAEVFLCCCVLETSNLGLINSLDGGFYTSAL